MALDHPSTRGRDWAWRTAFATLALSLAACGGGGGGGDAPPALTPSPAPAPAPVPSSSPAPSPVPPSFDLGSTFTRIYQTGYSARTVQATRADGRLVSQTISLSPQADEAFNGAVRKKAIRLTQTAVDGLALEETRTVYFGVDPFVLNGFIVAGTSTRYITTTSWRANLPTSARAGDSGEFYSSVTFAEDAPSVVRAISEVGWTIEPDGSADGSTVYACINTVVTDYTSASRPVARGSECYRIDASGTMLGLRVKLTYRDANGNDELLDLR